MPWIQLQIPTDPDNADQLEDLLMEIGAEAVSMEDAADQPLYEPDRGTTPLWIETRVTGLFDSERNIEQLCAEITDRWHQQTQQSLPDIGCTVHAWRISTPPICCWTPVLHLVPGPIRPQRCAWNGWTVIRWQANR